MKTNHPNINYYSDIESVIIAWKKLFEASSLTYFMSPAWHKIVLAFFRKGLLTKRLNQIRYFTVENESGRVEILGFFYLTKKNGQHVINFTHLLGPSDYYDFVYSSKGASLIDPELLLKIMTDQGASKVQFSHIKETSPLFAAAKNLEQLQYSPLTCVVIPLGKDYDSYLKSLKSSARQNMRTAYNRLRKADLNFEFKLHNSESSEPVDFQKLQQLYIARNKPKNQKIHWKSKLFALLDHGLGEKPDMFDLQELSNTHYTIGTLYIDGQLAAYFFGFQRNQSIEINRAVINDEFKFYSPGIVMFHEYIKNAIPQGLKEIDLTVGDEKYKFDLGGKTHEIFNIT